MNLGKVRRARVGETPTHYAQENIVEGEALVMMLGDGMAICSGSCGEIVPQGIAEDGGRRTESARTVCHHPKGNCHYIARRDEPCSLHRDTVVQVQVELPFYMRRTREERGEYSRSDRVWILVALFLGLLLVGDVAFHLWMDVMSFIGL